MIEFKGYEIQEYKLFRRPIKCTIEEFKLLTELCANINVNEITCEEFISKRPAGALSCYINTLKDIFIIILGDWTWGWDEINLELEYIEFSEVVKPINTLTENIRQVTPLLRIKQGIIVKATRYNGLNGLGDPYIWQGVYFGYCNGKHLIDFNGTHCMVADEVEVVSTLTKKEAKQKVSELFANNGKNVTSQKIREIIDLIELDVCNKEVLNGNNI